MRDGSRRVLEISEVDGIKDGEIQLNTLYRFTTSAEDGERHGRLVHTGNSLLNTVKLEMKGCV
jgi:pilus assembly protein CpaF